MSPSTVYFLSPGSQRSRIGGVKQLYRFAAHLRAAGIDAVIVPDKPKSGPAQWFEHDVPVAQYCDVRVGSGDLVVVPEVYTTRIPGIAPGAPKVILNQGPFMTFHDVPLEQTFQSPYLHRDVVGVAVVSDVGRRYMKAVHPQLTLDRIHIAINSDLFHARDRSDTRRLAVMGHKGGSALSSVVHGLRANGVLAGWDVAVINQMTEAQTAEVMRSSSIFVTASSLEGFGLPPFEAMACGCLVIGFPAQGGREFMDPRLTVPVPDGDVPRLLTAVEQTVRCWDSEKVRIDAMRSGAADCIATTYTTERERADVVGAFARYLENSRGHVFTGEARITIEQLAEPSLLT